MFTPRALAVTALLGSLALSAPAFAATTTSSTSSAPAASSTTTTTTSKHQASSKTMSERVEDRIATLHEKLNITPEQEDSWKQVAQAMRDNATNEKALWDERRGSGDTRTAVDDLKSYQKGMQAHVDGLGKVITAFEPLYENMSDDQKQNADNVFGRYEGMRDAANTGAPKKSAQ